MSMRPTLSKFNLNKFDIFSTFKSTKTTYIENPFDV